MMHDGLVPTPLPLPPPHMLPSRKLFVEQGKAAKNKNDAQQTRTICTQQRHVVLMHIDGDSGEPAKRG